MCHMLHGLCFLNEELLLANGNPMRNSYIQIIKIIGNFNCHGGHAEKGLKEFLKNNIWITSSIEKHLKETGKSLLYRVDLIYNCPF